MSKKEKVYLIVVSIIIIFSFSLSIYYLIKNYIDSSQPQIIRIDLDNPKITVTETYVLIESTDILKVDMEQGKKYSVAIIKTDYDKAVEKYERNKKGIK